MEFDFAELAALELGKIAVRSPYSQGTFAVACRSFLAGKMLLSDKVSRVFQPKILDCLRRLSVVQSMRRMRNPERLL